MPKLVFRCVFSLQVGDVHGAKVTPFWEEVLPQVFHGDLSGVVSSDEKPICLSPGWRHSIGGSRGYYDTVTWGLAPSSPRRATPAFLRAVARLSDERDLPVFTHVYESRATTLIARRSSVSGAARLFHISRRAWGAGSPHQSRAWRLDAGLKSRK